MTLRFRTFHNDVTGVKVRVLQLNAGGQQIVPMTLAADATSPATRPGLEQRHLRLLGRPPCPNRGADNLWYRFIVTDGTDTDYYADNTPALDGGLGAAERRRRSTTAGR